MIKEIKLAIKFNKKCKHIWKKTETKTAKIKGYVVWKFDNEVIASFDSIKIRFFECLKCGANKYDDISNVSVFKGKKDMHYGKNTCFLVDEKGKNISIVKEGLNESL